MPPTQPLFTARAPKERICLKEYLGVSKNRGTPKWMVKIMENPIKMDDLGAPHYFWFNTHLINFWDGNFSNANCVTSSSVGQWSLPIHCHRSRFCRFVPSAPALVREHPHQHLLCSRFRTTHLMKQLDGTISEQSLSI